MLHNYKVITMQVPTKLKYCTDNTPSNLCPLCGIYSAKYTDLWILMKHLRYAHPRLAFQLMPVTTLPLFISLV